MKIALTSTGPLSGKSTLAKHLEREHGFIRVDHSLTLVKSFVHDENILNGVDAMPLANVPPLTVEDIYADKECWRPRLQEYGEHVGFNVPGLISWSWIMETLAPWTDGGKKRDVVFDSARGEVQAARLHWMGFTLVQLEISESVRANRAHKLGKSYADIIRSMEEHDDIELGISNPDLRLDASLPVDQLARMVIALEESRNGFRSIK